MARNKKRNNKIDIVKGKANKSAITANTDQSKDLKLENAEYPIINLIGKVPSRKIDEIEEQMFKSTFIILDPATLKQMEIENALNNKTLKFKPLTKKNKETVKANGLTDLQKELSKSYENILSEAYIEEFNKNYSILIQDSNESMIFGKNSLCVFAKLLDLGNIFLKQLHDRKKIAPYSNEMVDKDNFPEYALRIALLTSAYKYFNNACSRLIMDYNTFHSAKYFLSSTVNDEIFIGAKREASNILYSLRDLFLWGIVIETKDLIERTTFYDIQNLKTLLSIQSSCLESKKKLELFYREHKLVDADTNEKSLSITVSLIIENIKRAKETANKYSQDMKRLKEFLTDRNEIMRDLIKCELLDQENAEKEAEEQRKAEFKKNIEKAKAQEELFAKDDVPTEEEREEQPIYEIKKLSLGEKEVLEGRELYNNREYYAAIEHFSAARDFFNNDTDIISEANARLAIADCNNAIAKSKLKKFLQLKKPFTHQELLYEAQAALERSIKGYKQLIEKFILNEQITVKNIEGKTYSKDDVINLFFEMIKNFEERTSEIDEIISWSINYLKKDLAEYKEYRENKYKELGTTHFIEKVISPIDPYVHAYISSHPDHKTWDKENMYKYLTSKTNLTPENIKNMGIYIWRNNPDYTNLTEEERIEKLKNTDYSKKRAALKQYSEFELVNNEIKLEITEVHTKIRAIGEDPFPALQNPESSNKSVVKFESIWDKVSYSEIIVNTQTSELCSSPDLIGDLNNSGDNIAL
jgi:hypothetical protein